MDPLISLLGLGKDYGPLVVIILGIAWIIISLVRTILDEDRSSAFRAKVYKSLFKITGKRETENKYIKNDINAKLNIARKKINYTAEILPRSVDIEWVDSIGDEDSYAIKEGEFVVCLDSSASQEKNIIRLANIIVKNTSLIGIRNILSADLKEMLELNITKTIISEIKDKKIMDFFFSENYTPAIQSSVEKRVINEKITEIDAKGMFTRILLSELTDFSQRVYGLEPRPFMLDEVESLMEFLYKIANKQYQIDVPLQFERTYIKTALILVADTNKILTQGIEPYLKSAIYNSEKGLYSCYLLVWSKENLGSHNKEAAEEFIKTVMELDTQILQKTKLKKMFEEEYKIIDNFGNKRNARMTKYIVKKSNTRGSHMNILIDNGM